jgi:hypothetical protein
MAISLVRLCKERLNDLEQFAHGFSARRRVQTPPERKEISGTLH